MTQRYRPVHLVLDSHDQVSCITTSERLIGQISPQQSSLTVYRDVSPLVALQYLEGKAPWRCLADDQAWQNLSQAMPEFQKHMLAYPEHSDHAIYDQIPPDFPPILVEGRSRVLETKPSVADISALRELTEIHMAAQNRRAVNAEHFRSGSLNATWAQAETFSVSMLYDHLDHLDRYISTDHGEDPRHSARMTQEFAETRFLINTLTNDESNAPTPGYPNN